MSTFDPAGEPYLTRALDGVQLIEASAGTGKTYTLATLFTRLIVEQRLRMGEVLAVTYTLLEAWMADVQGRPVGAETNSAPMAPVEVDQAQQ